MASKPLSRKQQNFTRLGIACVDKIKLVFKDILKSQITPRALYNAINSCSELTTGRQKLRSDQLRICSLSPPQIPDYDQFDVSLLYTLIRNLCPNLQPTKGWGKTPDPCATKIGDDIERLRIFRNEMFAHLESSEVPDCTFSQRWKELKGIIHRAQQFVTSLGYKVNYEEELAKIEKSDFGCDDMEKYKLLLEGIMIQLKLSQSTDIPVIIAKGNGKILCGEKACFEIETENYLNTDNWPVTWVRVRGSKTEVIDISKEKYNGSTSRRLVIPRVVKEDQGEYQAVISREVDRRHFKVQSNTLFLDALGDHPNLDIFQATSGIDGVTIHYNCNLEKPSPVIEKMEWKKDGELLSMDTNKYEGGGVTDKYLKILSPSENDSGEYKCRVFNAAGSDVKRIVLGAPSVEICKELTVLLGSEVTIDPVIQSCPSVEKAIWQKSKAQAPEDFMTIDINDDRYFGSSLDPEKPILVITNASHADNLYYRLEVTNGIRKSTSNAVLLKLVGDPPSVFINLETNIPDRSVTFLCKVSLSDNSPEVTKVVWKKENISCSRGKYSGGSIADPSLVIQNVNSNDAGKYHCCVSNAVGSMFSNPIHLGKPTVQISRPETDETTDKMICKATIESIPEPLTAEWRVQQTPEDDFQPIDIHASTYRGSNVSLPHPVLIVHEYSLKQGQRFQIKVTNFIGETTEVIHEKKLENGDHDHKEPNKRMKFYRKGGFNIPFANLRDDLDSSFPQEKLERLKHLLIDQEEINKDAVSASNSLREVLGILIQEGLFCKTDVILVQYLLRQIGCLDLYERCYKYAKHCGALCFFESQPENGYTNVKFHISGNIEEYSEEDISFIRKTVAKMLNCPEEYVVTSGVENDKSFLVILSIKEQYTNVLLKHAQQILEHLSSLNVDYLVCGETKIWNKNISQEQTVSQSADPEVSTASFSQDTTYTQTTSANTSKDVTPFNFSFSVPICVAHASTVVSDDKNTIPMSTSIREGESCMSINRKQDEDKALEIEHNVAKNNLLSNTSLSDSQEQNNDEEGNEEKIRITLDSEGEVSGASENKIKDIEKVVEYTEPWTDEPDDCVIDENEEHNMESEKLEDEDKLYLETRDHSLLTMKKKVRKKSCDTPVGVPGSGKSATAYHIASKLHEKGIGPRSLLSHYPFYDREGFGGFIRGREMPKIPSIASQQGWSRLHIYPTLFSVSQWVKPDEREIEIEEKEREKKREVELGLDTRREDRKREGKLSDRECRGSVDLERSKDRPFTGEDEQHPCTISSHSRSQSKSLAEGRVGSTKSDSSYNCDEKDIIKVKEEKVDESEISVMDRGTDKIIPESSPGASNLMDPSSLQDGPSQFAFGAGGIPLSQSLWGSQEKSLMDISCFSLQKKLEQEGEQLLHRPQSPTVGLYDFQRLQRMDENLLQEERLRRDYFDRSQQFQREPSLREKIALESSRLGHSRHFDSLSLNGNFPRSLSPLVNDSGIKIGSSGLLQGQPPPLMPSSSILTNRSNSNSPAMTKFKIPSNSDPDK